MLGGGDGSLWEIRGREMKGITGGCCKLHLYVIATCPVLTPPVARSQPLRVQY